MCRYLTLLVACCLLPALPTPSKADEVDTWHRKFVSASRSDGIKAADALGTIATRWPDTLSRYDYRVFYALVFEKLGASPQHQQARLTLLNQLFSVHWKLRYGAEPSEFWLELVRLLMERNELERAREVVPHIRAVPETIVLHVDKRFAPLVEGNDPVLSVEQAARHDVEDRRAAVASHPRSLEAVLELVRALIAAGKFGEALAIVDDALARVAENTTSSYDDIPRQLNWAHEIRGSVLGCLGLWWAVEKAKQTAASLPENGHPNVSNKINLAYFYVLMGRTQDALNTLRGAADIDFERQTTFGVSPYGAMKVAYVQLAAALAKDYSGRQQRKILGYLSGHRADDMPTYRAALLRTGQLDEYAKLLIEQLHDPLQRADALLSVQKFAITPRTPGGAALEQVRLEVLKREDVQAAIAEVGSIQQFSVP